MYASMLLLVSALVIVSATAIVEPRAVSSLGLGQPCSSSAQCANGAACYAVNSMQIPSCGNFQAACTTNSQCAFNSCVNGFCNGLFSSTMVSASLASTTSSTPASTGSDKGTIALGQTCSPSEPDQCMGGATCFAVNSMVIPLCGNFQSPCKSNAHCAFDTCINGVCNGFPSSPATTSATLATVPSGMPSVAAPSGMVTSTQQSLAKVTSGVAGAPFGVASTRAPVATIHPTGTITSGAHIQNATMTATGADTTEGSGGSGLSKAQSTHSTRTKHAATPSPTPTKKKSGAHRNGTTIGALLAVAAFAMMGI